MLQIYLSLPFFPKMNYKVNWDALGIATSIACAIHCAILPVIITSLPVFGINIVHNLIFEWSMIALAFVVGSYSLYHGHTRHHKNLKPLFIFTTGFIFLILKQFFPAYELWLLAIAVILIITAHYYNYRLCRQSRCASPHHKH
ncbi:MAG: MerC domain-containing protein [Ferruginibacter sp.]